jgi:hypothetical protein
VSLLLLQQRQPLLLLLLLLLLGDMQACTGHAAWPATRRKQLCLPLVML